MIHRSYSYSYGLREEQKEPWLQGEFKNPSCYVSHVLQVPHNSIDGQASRHQRYNNNLHSMAQ